jgi:predicted TPR repeat methyltransferase
MAPMTSAEVLDRRTAAKATAGSAVDAVVPAEVSVEEALAMAVDAHRSGELATAETLYRRILDVVPAQPDALHFLGVLSHQLGRNAEAIALIRRSLEQVTDTADWYNNYGNILLESGRPDAAADAYRIAIALAPGHADAWNNLGVLLRALGRLDEAESAYKQAIALDPGHIDAHNNMGNLLAGRGNLDQAVDYYCRVLTLAPGLAESRKLLGIAYSRLGCTDKATAVFREWLAEEPHNPVARHMVAACSGENVPLRAADDYVEGIFDGFAASFDAKLEHLGYRAPQLVATAAEAHFGAPAKRLKVLDAGCGTGLCGPLLKPLAQHLTGVDLSAGMLARAQARAAYDVLIKAELTGFLQQHASAFDLIVSADTLVYFGDLSAPLAAALLALRPAGRLILPVEELSPGTAPAQHSDGYRINPHGRYSHRVDYVSGCLAAAGFAIMSIDRASLRMEGGAPVAGLVVSAQRP